jgi:hypothetical protein
VYVESECSVRGEAVVTASEVDDIYKLNQVVAVPKHNALAPMQDGCSKELWHRRLDHLNGLGMCHLRNGMVAGVDFKDEKVEPCVPYIQGKQHQLLFNKSVGKRAMQKLSLVYSDLCGPMSETTPGGAKFMFVLVDDYTSYFLNSKVQIAKKLKSLRQR